jgi:hypothetical protein
VTITQPAAITSHRADHDENCVGMDMEHHRDGESVHGLTYFNWSNGDSTATITVGAGTYGWR